MGIEVQFRGPYNCRVVTWFGIGITDVFAAISQMKWPATSVRFDHLLLYQYLWISGVVGSS